jgi:hypothetical protein
MSGVLEKRPRLLAEAAGFHAVKLKVVPIYDGLFDHIKRGLTRRCSQPLTGVQPHFTL